MSFSNLNYHIVFSTKERRPFLQGDVVRRLPEYIGGIIKELGGIPVMINGAGDHLHVVAVLTPKTALMDCVQSIKGGSSKWVHETFADLGDFDWQDGYAAFTVSRSALDKVVGYVRGQEEHHKKMSFQEELIALLRRHGVQYDEKFVLG